MTPTWAGDMGLIVDSWCEISERYFIKLFDNLNLRVWSYRSYFCTSEATKLTTWRFVPIAASPAPQTNNFLVATSPRYRMAAGLNNVRSCLKLTANVRR